MLSGKTITGTAGQGAHAVFWRQLQGVLRLRPRLCASLEILCLAAIYAAFGKFGLSFYSINASATVIWPPTGIALAALLLRGNRVWPGVLIAAFIVNISTQGSLVTSLAIAAGNSCEALLGAWLIRRFAQGLRVFEHLRSFFRFVLLAGLVATTISPAVGVTTLCIGGFASWTQFGPIWVTWWLGDAISNLIIAPFLVLWAANGLPGMNMARSLEAAALFVTVLLAGLLVFQSGARSPVGSYPLTYLALLPLLWAASRFGTLGAVSAALLMDTIAIWGTIEGGGPFSAQNSHLSLLFLQVFSGTAAVTGTALALVIAERRNAELAVRQSQERLALVIEGSSDGIWDWDLATNEVYYSGRWKSMLGYEEAEVANRFSEWERLLHPEDRARAFQSVRAYLENQSPTFELEHRLLHKDGTYRWILSRGVALRDPSGRPVRMAGSHVDLTARKKVEDQLRLAYQELSQNETALKAALEELRGTNQELQVAQLQLIQAAKLESLGTLAAGVAHEVKNPLQTIIMGVDYLRNTLRHNSPDIAGVLLDMRDAVGRANAIVREMLQLSAHKDFSATVADLNQVVERSLWLINNQALTSKTRLVRNLDPALPPVRLDVSKMEQVFINLFINALQAMRQGGVLTVLTRRGSFGEDLKIGGPAFSHLQPGEPVVIAEVRDTGPGIPEAHLAKIFDPFFTTKPTGVGTGLGLSVVRKILEFHNAAIDVRNHPEGGAQVTVIFKLDTAARPERGADAKLRA